MKAAPASTYPDASSNESGLRVVVDMRVLVSDSLAHTSMVMPLLTVLLIAVPFLELFVIIQVADGIGVHPTIVLLLLVSIAGAWLLKQQGTSTWRRMRATM